MKTKAIAKATSGQAEYLAKYRDHELPELAHFVDRKAQTFRGVCVTIETAAPYDVRRDLIAPEHWQLGTIKLEQVDWSMRKKVRRYWGQLFPKSFHYPVQAHYLVPHHEVPDNIYVDVLTSIMDGGAPNFNDVDERRPRIETWDGEFQAEQRTVSVLGKTSEEFFEEDWEGHYLNHIGDGTSFSWVETGRPAKWANPARRDVVNRINITIPPEAVERFLSARDAQQTRKGRMGRPRNDLLRVAVETLLLWEVPVIEQVVQALFIHAGLVVPGHVSYWNVMKEFGMNIDSDGIQMDPETKHPRSRNTLEGHKKPIWHLPVECRKAWGAFARANRRLNGQAIEYPDWSAWPRIGAEPDFLNGSGVVVSGGIQDAAEA